MIEKTDTAQDHAILGDRTPDHDPDRQVRKLCCKNLAMLLGSLSIPGEYLDGCFVRRSSDYWSELSMVFNILMTFLFHK